MGINTVASGFRDILHKQPNANGAKQYNSIGSVISTQMYGGFLTIERIAHFIIHRVDFQKLFNT